jgi:hypothetical protein
MNEAPAETPGPFCWLATSMAGTLPELPAGQKNAVFKQMLTVQEGVLPKTSSLRAPSVSSMPGLVLRRRGGSEPETGDMGEVATRSPE